jgi:predicted N-acyltransferase
VDRFLEREREGVNAYMSHLEARSPFKTEPM